MSLIWRSEKYLYIPCSCISNPPLQTALAGTWSSRGTLCCYCYCCFCFCLHSTSSHATLPMSRRRICTLTARWWGACVLVLWNTQRDTTDSWLYTTWINESHLFATICVCRKEYTVTPILTHLASTTSHWRFLLKLGQSRTFSAPIFELVLLFSPRAFRRNGIAGRTKIIMPEILLTSHIFA